MRTKGSLGLLGLLAVLTVLGIPNAAADYEVPPFRWPLPGTPSERTILLDFGDDWEWTYCGGQPKRHTGVDLRASVGEDVYAIDAGTVIEVYFASSVSNWAKGIVIDHSGFTTTYIHVNPVVNVGDSVNKGQKIATIADIDGIDHLHFGFRAADYSHISKRGALPQTHGESDYLNGRFTGCESDPLFPEYFLDPKIFNYSGEEQPVYFPDANLKAAVEQKLGIADPTPNDMLSLTSLSAKYWGIADITGLEYATNLGLLSLWDNDVSDISALSGLTNLTVLYLDHNQIGDISALSGLTNLTELHLGYNYQISDISALSALTSLTWLALSQNQISDITALSGLTNLESLSLYGNQISDFSVLLGLTNLTRLGLGSNQISDITALSGLTNLESLSLQHNQISDISALSALTNLDYLYVPFNQISDISAVVGLTNLWYLNLRNNQISDISAVAGLTNLWYLYLQANPLNQDACDIYIPQILQNNPGIWLYYDPCPEPPDEPPAEKFQVGEIVRTTTALRVRDDNMNKMFWGKEKQTQFLPFGIVGQVTDGPRVEKLDDGQEYTFWKINWLWNAYGEPVEGWSAEGYSGEDWLVAVPSSEDKAYWLARMIMSEAGQYGELAQRAVGWTAKNRKKSPLFKDDIYDVVTQWAHYSLREEPTDEGIRKLAERILADEVTDPTDGADHFFSPQSMKEEDGYGPYPVPEENLWKAYYPLWAEPKDGWGALSSNLTSYVTTVRDNLQWRLLEGIRPWYFMFYRPYTLQISASIQSPGELRVYDSEGRLTGVVNGTVVSEIPGSECFNNTIVIHFPRGLYQYQVAGTFEGVYGLTVTAVTRQEDITFVAIEIPTSTNVIHQYTIDWDSLSQGQEGVTLQIDGDGDGEFEQSIITGPTLEAPVSVDEYTETNLGRVGYDRRTRRFSVNATVTNTSDTAIGSPVWLVIESISNPGVTLANADGTTIDGKEYIDLSGLLGDGQLEPGESVTKRLYFNNPNRVRFTFEPSIRGVILEGPE